MARVLSVQAHPHCSTGFDECQADRSCFCPANIFQVGSFLMSCLRRWLEQHQVKFPLCRAAILVLEADAISTSSPESACSLLVAAADGLGTPASIT